MDVGATLAQIFAELGATGPMVRTFLLRDRYFVGQRFRCGGFQAVLLYGRESKEIDVASPPAYSQST